MPLSHIDVLISEIIHNVHAYVEHTKKLGTDTSQRISGIQNVCYTR